MRVVTTLDELIEARAEWRGGRRTASFVPTMGYLHAGHLSLVERARAENEIVVTSIFVNPTQFAPHEDLARYPRDLPRDLALLEVAGADLVFTPAAEQVYPPGFNTYVLPQGPLAERLEAAVRPGHFRGVTTVVLKLFNLVQPARAYFGQKDAQQVAVLRRMVADLNVPVELRVQPTVREADGLAMSSRNAYLGPEDRAAAIVLFRALQAGAAAFDERLADGVEAARRAMEQTVAAEPRARLDYVDICDPDTFEPLAESRAPALLAVAARLGPARLIDNVVLRPGTAGWEMGVRTGAAQE
jgi:pantoate--beta-alanine ligase